MNKLLPWHIVEKSIQQEKKWLEGAIDFNFKDDDSNSFKIISKGEMLRQISIAIVDGRIRAREISHAHINGLWTDDAKNWELGEKNERHGGDWHRAMMNLIRNHFVSNNFEVTSEPLLNYGRADLGVFKESHPNLYVEVGTTSLVKVWINFLTMPEAIFLFVPSIYTVIEFQTGEFTGKFTNDLYKR